MINNKFVDNEGLKIMLDAFPSLKELNIDIKKGDVNSIVKNGKDVTITAMEPVYAFRMLSLAINENGNLDIKEVPTSNKLTYYTDCSRNAVVNLEYFKKMILTLASLGYNALSLYTEDTYEIEEEPYFGHMRGRYSKQEIKDMVKYAKMFGIELIPGIATLAHLDNIFFWPEYEKILDNADCIMIGDDRTYQLIDHMFKTLSECYETRRVHIGYDEAHASCLGRYYSKNGPVDRTEVILKHLEKVLEIAAKYGFKCSLWSDMFFRLQYNGDYYIKKDRPKFSDSILKLVPRNIELIYWDYYHPTREWYDSMIPRHYELSDDVAFAGGAWNWLGFAPFNKRAFIHSKPALKSARSHKVEKLYLTAWGDNGNECSRSSIIPSMVLYAESYNNGSTSDKVISKRLVQLTGRTLKDFFTLDILNEFKDNPGCQKMLTNPAKWVVYNDPLCGLFDYHISNEMVDYFKACLKKISPIAKKEGPYQYVFKTIKALNELMIVKAMIGNDLQKAYKENNKEELKQLANVRIPTIYKKLEKFEKLLREQWFFENKTFGFDVIQIRLGGQKNRLIEAQNRVNEYLDGKITRIEELEIEKLSQAYPWEDDKDLVYKHAYSRMASPVVNI